MSVATVRVLSGTGIIIVTNKARPPLWSIQPIKLKMTVHLHKVGSTVFMNALSFLHSLYPITCMPEWYDS
jgi:hypothetical protein